VPGADEPPDASVQNKELIPGRKRPPAEALFVVFGAEARFDNHN
jgi:hypothetical protein